MHLWHHEEEHGLFPPILILPTGTLEGSIARFHCMNTADPLHGQNVGTSVWEQLANYCDSN